MSEKKWRWTGNDYVEVESTGSSQFDPKKHPRDERGKFTFADNEPNEEIELSLQERAILRKEVFRKNAAQRGKVKPINHAYTANYFYVYETSGGDNFNVIIQLNIEKNREKINDILRKLNNGTNKK